MAHSKQAWEQFAETDKTISDAFLDLAKKGFLEWDIVKWLAEYRRAEATPLDSDDAEAALLTAKILEQACKEMESVGLEASNAGIRASNTFPPQELSDEEYERELKEHLVPLLDEGIEETESSTVSLCGEKTFQWGRTGARCPRLMSNLPAFCMQPRKSWKMH